MKVSIDSQGETGEPSGVDAASLWTLLAIVFFGAFLLMFLFFNRFIDVNDDIDTNDEIDVDPVQDSVDTPHPIDSDLDVPDAIDLDGSESPGVVGDTPVP